MRDLPRPGGTAPVRVVVVGPQGSGKTCFVTAAATESFPEHVPPTLPPTLLPGHALPDRTPCLLIDTSSRGEDRAHVVAHLRAAHVVILCYASDAPRQAILQALRTEWLPELRRASPQLPVVLLGCKLDATAGVSSGAAHPASSSAASFAADLAGEAPTGCVDASLECSARTLVAVHAAVYAACAAVLHPVAPLFDARQQALTPDGLAALRRMFIMADADCDGALSERELSAFQTACYGIPLGQGEAADIMRTVAERLPQGVTSRAGGGLTLPGFLFSQALLLQHGRCDAVWAALRAFGYGPQLKLQPEAMPQGAQALLAKLLPPKGSVSNADVVLELSPRGIAFVQTAFAQCAHGTSPRVWWPQLEALFSTSPGGAVAATTALGWTHALHWESIVSCASEDDAAAHTAAASSADGPGLTCAAFTALWTMSAACHPSAAVQQLCYLCYPGDPASAVRLAKRRTHRAHGAAASAFWRRGASLAGAVSAGIHHSSGRCSALVAVAGPPGQQAQYGDSSLCHPVGVLLDAMHNHMMREHSTSAAAGSADSHGGAWSAAGTPVPTSHGAGGPRAVLQEGSSPSIKPPVELSGMATPARSPVAMPSQDTLRTPVSSASRMQRNGGGGMSVSPRTEDMRPIVAALLDPVAATTPSDMASSSSGNGNTSDAVPCGVVFYALRDGWSEGPLACRTSHGSGRPDLMLFCFDARSRASFSSAAKSLNDWVTRAAQPNIPALLVGTYPPEDGAAIGENAHRLPWDDGLVSAFVSSLGMPHPIVLWTADPRAVESVLCSIAAAATASEPVIPETRAARSTRLRLRTVRRAATSAVGGAAVLSAGVYLYKLYRRASKDD